MWPKAVVSVDWCDPPIGEATIIDCYWGQGVGGEDPMRFRVRLHTDGTLTNASKASRIFATAFAQRPNAHSER